VLLNVALKTFGQCTGRVQQVAAQKWMTDAHLHCEYGILFFFSIFLQARRSDGLEWKVLERVHGFFFIFELPRAIGLKLKTFVCIEQMHGPTVDVQCQEQRREFVESERD